jgi:hypothetical protein
MRVDIKETTNVLAGVQGLTRFVRDGSKMQQVIDPFIKEGNPGFRCKCGTLARRPVRIVTDTRPAVYYGTVFDDKGHEKEAVIGTGWEIVKEELVCQRCAGIRSGQIIPAQGQI